MLKFETIYVEGAHNMSRAKVPGGWLVLTSEASITFVPDPDHTWDGSSED
jgi:hypothetical protein